MNSNAVNDALVRGSADAGEHGTTGLVLQPLLRRWVIAFIGSEIVGFGLAGMIGAGAVPVIDGSSDAARAPLAIGAGLLAGLVEGAAVGWAQWHVLQKPLPAIGRRAWVGATAAGAALAWAIGMALGTLAAPAEEPPFRVVAMVAAFLGAGLGAVLGVGQWIVLRRHVRQAGLWVAANAVGWTTGMVVAFGGTGIIDERSGLALIVTVAALTGATMALGPALATGWALLHLTRSGRDDEQSAPRHGRRRPRLRSVLNRIANPVVVVLLRSPLHGLLDRQLMLVTLHGRRTGQTRTFPVGYVEDGSDLIAISHPDRTWWRNLEDGAPVTLRLRGADVTASGAPISETAERHVALAQHGSRLLHRDLTDSEIARLAERTVIVTFRRSPTPAHPAG